MDAGRVIGEFTHQAASFNASPVMRSAGALGALLELVAGREHERWLDAACGPGVVARAIAPTVSEVHGVDLTPAMVDLARREAAAAGLANTSFSIGDATALAFEDASFDGALTRFSLHHIPLPGRVVGELSRVVHRGGQVVLADHVTSSNAEVAAWHQEVERLRDPSHWACLTPEHLRRLGRRAGLSLEHDAIIGLSLDFEEWLTRGSGGEQARDMIECALGQAPADDEVFHVSAEPDGGRRLELRYWLSRWQR